MIKNQVKTLENLVEEYKSRKVNYSTYEFDELSYRTLILDIHTMLKENQKYKEVINELRNYLEARIEICVNRLSTPFCDFENTTKERLILSQCLEKLEELEVEHE